MCSRAGWRLRRGTEGWGLVWWVESGEVVGLVGGRERGRRGKGSEREVENAWRRKWKKEGMKGEKRHTE